MSTNWRTKIVFLLKKLLLPEGLIQLALNVTQLSDNTTVLGLDTLGWGNVLNYLLYYCRFERFCLGLCQIIQFDSLGRYLVCICQNGTVIMQHIDNNKTLLAPDPSNRTQFAWVSSSVVIRAMLGRDIPHMCIIIIPEGYEAMPLQYLRKCPSLPKVALVTVTGDEIFSLFITFEMQKC